MAVLCPVWPPADVNCSLNTYTCLLYTSDAADDLLCVDLGGRRIIKKKKKIYTKAGAKELLKDGHSQKKDVDERMYHLMHN